MRSVAEQLPEDFVAALAASAADRGVFGARLHYFTETASTNDLAAAAAERGDAEGTTFVAGAQTSGRGRLGRTWFSPPGAGLYLSTIVRRAALAPWITLAGGVAVAEGIRAATALPVQIKWPGINLRTAAYPPELADRAGAIEAELGRRVDAGAVLAQVLAGLNRALGELAGAGAPALFARWLALSPSAHGAAIEWDAGPATRRGTTAGLAEDGALLARTPTGLERIIAGEVRWV